MANNKFKIRRRMAITSYILICILIFVILAIVFFGSATVAANLSAASAILITLIGALVAIIGHYNQMVYSTDKEKDKKDVDKDS